MAAFSMEQGGTRAWFSESDSRHCIKIGSVIRFSVKRCHNPVNLSELHWFHGVADIVF